MPRKNRPTIRHRIKKRLSPIPCHMKSHRKPQAPRAPQRQTKEKSNRRRRQQSRPLLAPIRQMDQAKSTGQHNRRRPETNRPRQRELRISAKQKIFKQSHQQKVSCPERRKLHNARAMDRQAPHLKHTQPIHHPEQQRDARKSPHRAHPKQFPERLPHRQPIRSPRAASQLSPAPAPESPPPPEPQTPPASSTTAHSRLTPATPPTGWPQIAADKTSPHKTQIPIPPSILPDQETPSSHTTAAPQSPASEQAPTKATPQDSTRLLLT